MDDNDDGDGGYGDGDDGDDGDVWLLVLFTIKRLFIP